MPETNTQDKGTDPKVELGVTGLRRYGHPHSHIDEELHRDLAGTRGVRVYRDMSDNDPVVGAFLYAIEMLARGVPWRMEGEDEELVEFVESCIGDMSHSWEEFISEVLSMLEYGWAYHETVYKVRNGDSQDPSQRSRYTDGRIGWRKLAIRAQDTLQYWVFDDEGGIRAMVQNAPPYFRDIELPIEKCLLFRVKYRKGNPEGRSILRNAYRPWHFKRRIEEYEAIGVERDLAGMPVIKRTNSIANLYDEDLKKILKNVRRNAQEGILLPLVYDDMDREGLTFELLSTGGRRQFDTTKIIEQKNQAIATSVMGEVLLLGSKATGSYALGSVKQKSFTDSMETILSSIAAVINTYAIPRLLRLNNFPLDDKPVLVPGKVGQLPLSDLSELVSRLAQAGAMLFPDDDLENYIRERADLPRKPEDDI